LEKAIDGGGIENSYIGLRHFGYDSTLNPSGKSTVTVMLYADFDWWKSKYKDNAVYIQEKERLATEVKNVVETNYPETRGKIDVIDVATPMTYVRYCNAWRGAWMSWAPTPKSKIRYIPGSLPGLDGFQLTGQWTMPPGGLPVAVVTGRWVIQSICGLEKQRFKSN
jgi:phytoene dehydrogenase-like protein